MGITIGRELDDGDDDDDDNNDDDDDQLKKFADLHVSKAVDSTTSRMINDTSQINIVDMIANLTPIDAHRISC